jgi:hypothetical protein
MDPDDVRCWCAAFGCTEDQLARAIAQVGALSGDHRRGRCCAASIEDSYTATLDQASISGHPQNCGRMPCSVVPSNDSLRFVCHALPLRRRPIRRSLVRAQVGEPWVKVGV